MITLRKMLMALAAGGVLSVGSWAAQESQAYDHFPAGNYGQGGYSQQSGHFGGGYSQPGNRYGGYSQQYGQFGGGYGAGGSSQYRSPQYQAPHYHAPSVHIDRVYHADRLHWTPFRGLHTHGHYDNVPHATPGYFHQ